MNAPLSGKTIVVTRAVEQAQELIRLLRDAGAYVIHVPTIEIGPPDSWTACDLAIQELDDYSWIIFTSTNGVRFFLNRLNDKGENIATLQKARIAAVGESTRRELNQRNIPVDLVPAIFRSEGLVEAFMDENIQGLNILIPGAQMGRELLLESLTSMGAKVAAVPVYKNRMPKVENFSESLKMVNGHPIDVLTFTSPSMVQNFISLFGRKKIKDSLTHGCKIAAIGGVTAEAVKKLQLQVDISPQKSTIKSFVEEIAKFYQ